MEPDCVIPNTTASTLYEVPLLLEREGLAHVVCRKLELACGAPDLTAWSEMVARIKTASRHVSIALVGNIRSCTTRICPSRNRCSTRARRT